MRRTTGTAAMAAIVMTGLVPAGFVMSTVTSQSLTQMLCSGALGGEWTAGSCGAPATAARPLDRRTY